MSRDQMKPKDKVVTRMTRDGAVEENLTEGTSEKISKRLEDAQLVKPHDEENVVLQDETTKRRQPIPEDLLLKQDGQTSDPTNTQTDDKTVHDEYLIHEPTPHTNTVPEVHHSPSINSGMVIAKTAATSSARRTQTVEAVDAEAILGKAAETAAEKPVLDEAAPTTKKIQRLEKKSEKAHERLDAAREKLPTKKVLKKERVFDDEKGKNRN